MNVYCTNGQRQETDGSVFLPRVEGRGLLSNSINKRFPVTHSLSLSLCAVTFEDQTQLTDRSTDWRSRWKQVVEQYTFYTMCTHDDVYADGHSPRPFTARGRCVVRSPSLRVLFYIIYIWRIRGINQYRKWCDSASTKTIYNLCRFGFGFSLYAAYYNNLQVS